MADVLQSSAAPAPALNRGTSLWPDLSFRWLALLAALTILGLVALVGWELFRGAHQAVAKFGPGFLVKSTWDPVSDVYGALPFIYGTLVSSIIALLIAVPLGVATALYLTEMAPLRLRQPVITIVEMLAAVPSVIFGLWGIFVLIPWLRDHLYRWLKECFGFLPLFSGPIYGVGMLTGGIIVATMALVVSILFSIAAVRVLDVYAFRNRVWASDALIGGLLTLLGIFAWTKRRSPGAS